MNLLGLLENGLFALGQVLRFPVMALLWVCVAAALFAVGRVLADFVTRRRERRDFAIDSWLAGGRVFDSDVARRARLPAELRQMLERIEHAATAGHGLDGGALEHLVLEAEERGRAVLTIPRLLVKVGPSLGLLGTLIPMGTALAALSTGNLEAMAGQMVVAFTTTIVGLACGTIGFIALAVRQHWVTQTVREQRYLADQVLLARDGAEVNTHG